MKSYFILSFFFAKIHIYDLFEELIHIFLNNAEQYLYLSLILDTKYGFIRLNFFVNIYNFETKTELIRIFKG